MKDKTRQKVSLYLYHGARIVLGLVFIYASYDKILHPAEFAKIIYNHQIVPDELINLTAIFLPWLELIAGCLLLSGLWLAGSAFISNILFIIYLCLLIYNNVRGLDVNCGCFSTSLEGNSHSILNVVRNFIFVIISGFLFIKIYLTPSSSEKK